MMPHVFAVNPLVPTGTDVLLILGALVHIVLALWAVLGVLRAQQLTFGTQLAYIVLTLVVPLVGPLLALAVSRRTPQSA
ncbi:hypothetical protein FEF26_09265 [Nesterenkonia salmonea]|uniref:Uncharacterized protein n=1 Tax=Nesterenkonia salmonea TaxID=1804987 RepID=A0A5R9BBD1_9MICC|nr:hypothetical protein [Nesterenkonia salmonea]TLP96379.1 hypothetical protein FEF26_09265 [Nesterenkonia salmonea]